MRIVFAAAAWALAASAAWALDPATVKGSLRAGGAAVTLTHAAAVQRDNAEGLMDSASEIRVALTDRPVTNEQLWGIAFLPVTTAAMRGELRGVLLRWDPAKPDNVLVTVLEKPEPGFSLGNTSVGRTGGALPEVKVAGNRVGGKVEFAELAGKPLGLSAAFSAPLFHERAVTADLKGAAAKRSPQVQTLQAIAQGLAKGDWNAQRALATPAANAQFELMMAQAGSPDARQMAEFARRAGADLRATLPKIDRVVVRDTRAIVLMGKGAWRQMALDAGTWKIDE